MKSGHIRTFKCQHCSRMAKKMKKLYGIPDDVNINNEPLDPKLALSKKDRDALDSSKDAMYESSTIQTYCCAFFVAAALALATLALNSALVM